MANYISCHTIACMTLQQIRYLQTLLEDQDEIQLTRMAGSQLSGKLVIELEAESREQVERVFKANNVHCDWLMRVEFDHRFAGPSPD